MEQSQKRNHLMNHQCHKLSCHRSIVIFEVSSLDVIQQSDGNSCGKFVVYYLIMTYYLMNTDIYHPTNFIHLLRKKLVPDCIN